MSLARVLAGAGTAAVVYTRLVRPRLMHWGATDAEISGPYPGAELVPGGERSGAMAVTIDAPPDRVWPWLVQMGWDRGGWYSWDLLDNAGRPSAQAIHPEWQDLTVGDSLDFWAPGRGPMKAYEVAVLERVVLYGLYPPVVWIMQARMLSVLKRNVERATRTRTEPEHAVRT